MRGVELLELSVAVTGAAGCVTSGGAYASFAAPVDRITFVDAVNVLYHSLGVLFDERSDGFRFRTLAEILMAAP